MINIEELTQRVIDGEKVTYEMGVELLTYHDKEALYAAADKLRKHFCGDTMDLCSITNAKSGKCGQNCKWCTQSAHHNTEVEEYNLVDKERAIEEMLDSAKHGVNRHSLVTSGRKVSNRNLDKLLEIYDEVHEKTNMKLCASMGLVEKDQLQKLKDAGVSHYHCNLETAPSYFPELCTTHTQEDKIEVIKNAQEMGIPVCSGGIIGMGETQEQRVELASALADLGIMSIPLNILMPMEGTPLAKCVPVSEEEVLTCIAIFRFINPKANIRFAGGRQLIKHYEAKALRAGINSALTGNYLTTIGSNVAQDIENFKASGFTIVTD